MDHAPGLGRLYWLLGALIAASAWTWLIDRGIRAMHPCNPAGGTR